MTASHQGGRGELQAPLLFLLGPTGTGKSELGVDLAEALGAELLSLDSMLVYRGMDVGTAKPGPELRSRVPHRLLDLVDPPERFDLHRYLAAAELALAEAAAQGRRALFVGGTALYAKALLAGVFDGPPHDPALRAAIEARGRELGPLALHAELGRRDPSSAARLHPHDQKRVVRALEVLEASGRPLSDWQREWRDGQGGERAHRRHRIAVLERAREEHESALRRRVEAMLDAGWIDEVRGILDRGGFGPTSSQAIGYGEVQLHLAGHFDREELVRRVALATRQFARRQRTWLRRFPGALTLEGSGAVSRERALAHLEGREPT